MPCFALHGRCENMYVSQATDGAGGILAIAPQLSAPKYDNPRFYRPTDVLLASSFMWSCGAIAPIGRTRSTDPECRFRPTKIIFVYFITGSPLRQQPDKLHTSECPLSGVKLR